MQIYIYIKISFDDIEEYIVNINIHMKMLFNLERSMIILKY